MTDLVEPGQVVEHSAPADVIDPAGVGQEEDGVAAVGEPHALITRREEAGSPHPLVQRLGVGRAARRETMTTNDGKFWLSLPSPYETHAPSDGRPAIWLPVCMKVAAGSWLIASVCKERIRQSSSMTFAVRGSNSLSQMPLSPRGANLKIVGVTARVFCPEVMPVKR